MKALNGISHKYENVTLNLRQKAGLAVFGTANLSPQKEGYYIIKCPNCKKYYIDQVHGMSISGRRFECPHCKTKKGITINVRE
jgi:transposase-like protein